MDEKQCVTCHSSMRLFLRHTSLKSCRPHRPAFAAGKKIKDKDVIELRTGGTGYAAHDGDKVLSQKWVVLRICRRRCCEGHCSGRRMLTPVPGPCHAWSFQRDACTLQRGSMS